MKGLSFLALLAYLLSSGCSTPGQETTGPMKIIVTVPPQAFLVERIGGEHVDVRVMVPAGQDPHTFEPKPRQLAGLRDARLYFKVGMPLEERLIEKINSSRKGLEIVDTSRGIERRGAGPDPHIWLGPPQIRVQAENIAAALIEADASNAGDYMENLSAFLRDLDEVDTKVAATLKPFRGQSFFVMHAAFGYFGDAYGLIQEAVEVGGKTPSPRQIQELIKRARSRGIRIIFVQPQFDRTGAQVIAEAIGGAVVAIDPMEKDVLSNLLRIAAKIVEAMRR